MNRKKLRVVVVTVGLAAVAGVLVVCYMSISAEAYGRPAYFRRLAGVSFEAREPSMGCPPIRYGVRMFFLPVQFTRELSAGRVSLDGYPEKAGYQDRHTLVQWHLGPPRDEDWRFVGAAVDAISLAAGRECETEASDIRLKLWAALQRPTTWLAYSYIAYADQIGVMSFFVIDLEGSVFYDVEYAT